MSHGFLRQIERNQRARAKGRARAGVRAPIRRRDARGVPAGGGGTRARRDPPRGDDRGGRSSRRAPAKDDDASLDEFAAWWGATGGEDAKRELDRRMRDDEKPRPRDGGDDDDAEPRGGADADARRRSTSPSTRTPAAPAVVDAGASRDGEAFDEWNALDEELERGPREGRRPSPGAGDERRERRSARYHRGTRCMKRAASPPDRPRRPL